MKKNIVSVIVPIYNSEKTLKRCIESILFQSYKYFELLLIDDGSSDSSLDICNLYVLKDSRIKVFNQKNQGVSAARNLGIKVAMGDRVLFVDSDDSLPIDSLRILLTYDNDLVIGGYREKENLRCLSNLGSFENKQQIIQLIEKNHQNPLLKSIWSKLFKMDIIKNNNLFFDIHLRLGEDTVFLLNYLQHVNSIFVSSCSCYDYSFDNNIYYAEKYANGSFSSIFDFYSQVYELSQSLGLDLKHNLYCSPFFVFEIAKFYLQRNEKEAFKDIRAFVLRNEVWEKLNNKKSINIYILTRFLKYRFFRIIPLYLNFISQIRK